MANRKMVNILKYFTQYPGECKNREIYGSDESKLTWYLGGIFVHILLCNKQKIHTAIKKGRGSEAQLFNL